MLPLASIVIITTKNEPIVFELLMASWTYSSPPTTPRPSQSVIFEVLKDLASFLSNAECDPNGLRHAAIDEIKSLLQESRHSGAAIDWAIYEGSQNAWLSETTCKRDQRSSNPRRGIAEIRPNFVNVPAVAATYAFLKEWHAGRFEPRTPRVVFLIHGIRTHANWQLMVKRVIEETCQTRVVPLKYGYFDMLRFWCPLLTRKGPIEEVRREIQNARNAYPDAEFSVIAHSFGTYIISHILLDNPDLRLKHLVLSGCIIPRRYRWDYVKERIETTVINDYGTRDIWPVLAKSLSWGYGDTGRHGFGRGAAIIDRGHDYRHSDFFNESFVRRFWQPWFDRDEFVSSEWNELAPPSPWWLSLLSILPVQRIVLVVLVTAMLCGLYQATLSPLHQRPPAVVADERQIPRVSLLLHNTTDADISVATRGDIVIWLPQGVDNIRRIPGRYDFDSPLDGDDGSVLIKKNASVPVEATVYSEIGIDALLTKGVGDLEFILRLDPGGVHFSGAIPFQRDKIAAIRYQIELSKENLDFHGSLDARWSKTNVLLNELSVYQRVTAGETGFVSRESFESLLKAIDYPDDIEFIAARDNVLAAIEATPRTNTGAAEDLMLTQGILSSLERLFTLAKIRVLEAQDVSTDN
jgi:pimeloyl-ACP methyl ester carboxylesterase